jgi:predicted transcriptional regulator
VSKEVTVSVDAEENSALSFACVLYLVGVANKQEAALIQRIATKFSEAIDHLTEEQRRDSKTVIQVTLTAEEAAPLVRTIDLVTGRDPSLENVRTQLGGGETTKMPQEEEGSSSAGALFLFGGAA